MTMDSEPLAGRVRPPSAEPQETLTRQAYGRLRQDILAGVLPPDHKLKVELLRQKLGMGASPIREALSLLTSDGLVERFDNRGFRVADVSLAEFDDLQQTRCWVEERALRDSIRLGSQAWEEEVVLAQHRLLRAPRVLDDGVRVSANPEWEVLHKRFHTTLLAACPSKTILRFRDQLYDRITRYRNLAISRSHASRDWNTEHAEIAQAVLERNADLAVERLMRHYQRTGGILRSVL